MCGIVGIITKDGKPATDKARAIFKQMLYCDVLRGQDSTGIFKVKDNKQQTTKTVGSPNNLLWQIDKDKWELDGSIIVGHNRASTKGASTKENAHPFTEEHITLVHNGTLFTHRHLANVDVDSHAICHTLVKHTAEETANKIDGAYALVWWDEKAQILNLLRNKERPLFLIQTENYYVISSEKELAVWICARNKEKIVRIEDVQPNIHYQLFTAILNDKETITIKRTKLKIKEKVQSSWFGHQYEYYNKAEIEENESTANKWLKEEGVNVSDVVLCWFDKRDATGTANSWPKNFGVMAKNAWDTRVHLWYKDKLDGYVFCKISRAASTDLDNQEVPSIAVAFERYATDDEIKIVFAELAKEHEQEKEEKKTHTTTLNGIPITKNLKKFLKDRCCISCQQPYKNQYIEDRLEECIVKPQEKDGHIYSYKYFCSDCSPLIKDYI